MCLETWLRTDVTITQFKILLLLRVHGPMPVGHITRALGTTGPTVTEIVKRMRSRGWVYKQGSLADERIREVRLTAAGLAYVNELINEITAAVPNGYSWDDDLPQPNSPGGAARASLE